jgi:hypothetical protein
MASRYPVQIDTLPTVVDNVTPIRGSVVNDIRNAVLAVESELGIKPSATYGTVRARLDLLEKTTNGITGLNEKNGSYALTISDMNLVIVFVITGGVVATLPLASTMTAGNKFTIVNATHSDLIVDGNGTPIYGAGSYELLNDSESRIYFFNPGLVSGLATWMRI